MPRPRKPQKRRYRKRGTGSISWCARLALFEARVPRSLGRTASYHQRKADAERWLAAQIAGHQERTQLPGADERLGTYLERWGRRMESTFGPSRLASARQMAARAAPLWPYALADLRYQHVADWVAGLLNDGMAPSTVGVYKQLLSQAIGDLVPDVLPSNPAARTVRLPKPATTTMPEHLEELEAQRFLKAAQGTRGYPLWRLMLGTGMRIGEALGFRWEDIDLTSGVAEFDEQWSAQENKRTLTKSRRGRTVTLRPAVLAALLELPHRTGLLFPGRAPGKPVGRTAAKVWFAATLKAAGLPSELTPHALRHTFASVALSRGVAASTVALTLGHSSMATTVRVYAHALRQRQGEAERALDEALAGVF